MSAEMAGKIVEHAAKHELPVYAHTESYAEFADAVHLGVHGVMHSVLDTLIHDFNLIERIGIEITIAIRHEMPFFLLLER